MCRPIWNFLGACNLRAVAMFYLRFLSMCIFHLRNKPFVRYLHQTGSQKKRCYDLANLFCNPTRYYRKKSCVLSRYITIYNFRIVNTCTSVASASYFARPPCCRFEYRLFKGICAEETISGVMPIAGSVKVNEMA